MRGFAGEEQTAERLHQNPPRRLAAGRRRRHRAEHEGLRVPARRRRDLDRPRGIAAEALSGVTHEDCATFAQDFGTLLDVEDLVPGSQEYTLEVSSPGIDRKLFKAADYERFAGSLVKVKTFHPVNGQKVITGRMSFENGIVKLDLAAVKQKGKAKKASGSVYVDFAQQLLTSHPAEAARAFTPIVTLFGEVLDEAATAGAIRPGLRQGPIAGIVLEAIMFNAFSVTIAGGSSSKAKIDPAEELWDLILHGVAKER